MSIEDNIRSDEVQEIMDRMPKRFILWGTSSIFILIILLVLLSTIIHYPDIINGNTVLTTTSPPRYVMAKSTGLLKNIFVDEKAKVKIDEPLAVLENTANYKNILWIDSVLNTPPFLKRYFTDRDSITFYYKFWIKNKDKTQDIGEVTMQFSEFINSLNDYSFLITNNITFQQAKGIVNNKSQDLIKITNRNRKMYLDILKKEIDDKTLAVINKTEQLKIAIALWKEKYLLKAPIRGTIAFQNHWSVNQEINGGNQFCMIIPESKSFICKVYIHTDGSSKIHIGQKVRLVFSKYPENEFGYMQGRVKSISSIPIIINNVPSYIVTVTTPVPMITSLNKSIKYTPEMQGMAEILTDEKTIFNRLTENWLSYWNKK